MSWHTDLTKARAREAALEAAELAVLSGQQVKSVAYDGERVEYGQGATLGQLQGALREVRMVIQRLSGGARTGGAIIPILGR